jgi:hypothetical protein
MAPRNQTKKTETIQDRWLRADIKEAAKAIKKQQAEDKKKNKTQTKHQANLEELAELQAELKKLTEDKEKLDMAKAGPVNESKPELVAEANSDP